MFSTCIFCHGSLGANQCIEHFPVGERLAFDSQRGRLWAVCPKCARWNLTPLEERWEALEECERAYRDTRKRVSTDNIALARLREGTDLIRIGQPLRPEFAAWRYARVMTKRRWKMLATSALGGIGLTAVFNAPVFLASAVLAPLVPLSSALLIHWQRRDQHWRRHLSIPLANGELARMTRFQMHISLCRLDDGGELWVKFPYGGRRQGGQERLVDEKQIELAGQSAHDALRRLIVGVNQAGASRAQVADSVTLIEDATKRPLLGYRPRRALREDPLLAFMQLLTETEKRDRAVPHQGMLGELSVEYRLALEMTLHEDDERRAMSGELGALYARWEEAERVAKIADADLTAFIASANASANAVAVNTKKQHVD